MNLYGKTICFTGTLESMTRNEAKRRVSGLGAIVKANVSRGLDILVVGQKPGRKFWDSSYGKVMTEKAFLKAIRPSRGCHVIRRARHAVYPRNCMRKCYYVPAKDIKCGWRVNFGTPGNPRVFVVHGVVTGTWRNLVQIRSVRSQHQISCRPDTLVMVASKHRALNWRTGRYTNR